MPYTRKDVVAISGQDNTRRMIVISIKNRTLPIATNKRPKHDKFLVFLNIRHDIIIIKIITSSDFPVKEECWMCAARRPTFPLAHLKRERATKCSATVASVTSSEKNVRLMYFFKKKRTNMKRTLPCDDAPVCCRTTFVKWPAIDSPANTAAAILRSADDVDCSYSSAPQMNTCSWKQVKKPNQPPSKEKNREMEAVVASNVHAAFMRENLEYNRHREKLEEEYFYEVFVFFSFGGCVVIRLFCLCSMMLLAIVVPSVRRLHLAFPVQRAFAHH